MQIIRKAKLGTYLERIALTDVKAMAQEGTN